MNAGRYRLLDLFCGEGGAGMGYHLAGFEVVGVDNTAMPRNPFDLVIADALEVLHDRDYVRRFDVIHASPPCQSETSLRMRWRNITYPDLLGPTLKALEDVDIPWIVENVSASKQMPDAITLCGAAFRLGTTCADGVYRNLKRHRLFKSSMPITSAGCHCVPGAPVVGVYGYGGGGPMTRGYKGDLRESRDAMGIEWMSRRGISQAIPPAYTKALGEQVLTFLRGAA